MRRWIPLIFGEWAPDYPTLSHDVLSEARNVLWHDNAYRPLRRKGEPTPLGFSSAITARANLWHDGAEKAFLADKTGAVYGYTPTGTAAALTGAPTSQTGDFHPVLLQFGNEIILGREGLGLHKADAATATPTFAAIENAPTSITAGAVIQQRLLVGGGRTIHWSAAGRSDIWAGSSEPRDAGSYTLPSGGSIVGIAAGELVAFVFCANAIFSLTPQTGAAVFSRREIATDIGCLSRESIVRTPDAATRQFIFLSERGVIALDENGVVRNIGENRVNNWLAKNLDYSRRDEISAALDFDLGMIFWMFPNTDGITDLSKNVLIYNYLDDRFTYSSAVAHRFINYRNTVSTQMDSFNIDGLTQDTPLDDPKFRDRLLDRLGEGGASTQAPRVHVLTRDTGDGQGAALWNSPNANIIPATIDTSALNISLLVAAQHAEDAPAQGAISSRLPEAFRLSESVQINEVRVEGLVGLPLYCDIYADDDVSKIANIEIAGDGFRPVASNNHIPIDPVRGAYVLASLYLQNFQEVQGIALAARPDGKAIVGEL